MRRSARAWILIGALVGSLAASCDRFPGLGAPARPTSTPKPTSTPVPVTGLSDVVLRLEDLPQGFESVPLREVDWEPGTRILDWTIASAFAFFNEESVEIVGGYTILVPDPAEQAVFDQDLDDPDFLQAVVDEVAKDLRISDVVEPRVLAGLTGFGDASGGVTFLYGSKSAPLRMDAVALRRGEVAAFVVSSYPRDAMTLVPISAAVQKIDDRGNRLLEIGN